MWKDKPERREGAVIVHNNFVVGHDAKVERFREAGLWFDGGVVADAM